MTQTLDGQVETGIEVSHHLGDKNRGKQQLKHFSFPKVTDLRNLRAKGCDNHSWLSEPFFP